MKAVVLQSNYIPWKGYFELINDSDIFCFYDEVQYTKNDWRNRNKVVGQNGDFWLTIPVSKESVKQKISDVRLVDHSWQEQHLKSIEHSYHRAPFKKEVLSLLRPIYLEKPWTHISELNQHMIKEISRFIGIKTEFKDSKNFKLSEGRLNRLVDLVVQLEGTVYISGPAAKNYLAGNENLFSDKKIELRYKEYGPYLKYVNHHNDFVSIIDVMMNVHKEEVLSYITSLKK